MQEYVFLMRHAAHDAGTLSQDGLSGTRGVGGRLAEWLDGRDLTVTVHTTGSQEVAHTASILVQSTKAELRRLAPPGTDEHHDPFVGDPTAVEGVLPPGTRIDTVSLGAYRTDPTSVTRLTNWLNGNGTRHAATAPLLVGNDPLIGWLAQKLVASDVAVARGELICLARPAGRTTWRLAWTLAPGDGSQAAPIRDKVKSKMNTAGALGSVVTGLLVFLLRDGIAGTPSIHAWLAFVAMATSAALYFSALFLYDSLLMPERFWGSRFRAPTNSVGGTPAGKAVASVVQRIRRGRPGIQRPPSSTARVLQQAMVHIWQWIFLPATIWAAIGVVLLILQAANPVPDTADALRPGPAQALMGILWAVATAAWVLAHRPDLGASD